MASDMCYWCHPLPFAAYAMASVIISVFLYIFLFVKKRESSGNNSSGTIKMVSQTQQQEADTSDADGSSSGHDFEVFLSFRGSDSRRGFTDYLYHSLMDAGVCAFRDNEELRVGEEIGPRLMTSIKQSKISIPIFSKDYASSKWCLKEVAEMVKCMKERKQLIMPVFLDVTPDEVQHQTGTYAKAFAQHVKKYDSEMVQEWRNALREAVKLKGLELEKVANGHQGELTKLIVAMILRELKKSYLEVSRILVGIDDHVEEVVSLLGTSSNDVRIIGIWGMGGIGKTTLAKVVHNQIVHCFECHSFLCDVRETSRKHRGLQYLQSKLVSDILRREREEFANIEEGTYVLKNRLRNKKALILLDDVDHVKQLKALAADLSWFGRGTRIIITTRGKEVLDQFQVQDTYEVQLLSEDLAFRLFCKHAFRDDLRATDFVEESRIIVKITGRLPLALEVIGSFLSVYRGRKEIWDGTIEKLKRKPHMEVQDKLRISYESLDREQQELFLDIACIFIGMDVRDVIPMWDNCKFFPDVGIEILILKSLIKIGKDHKLWMHDQLRDFGRHIVEQENYKEPELRSRLWCNEDAMDVLKAKQGTSKIEAICLVGYPFITGDDCLVDELFKSLSKLRILLLAEASLDGNFRHLLPKLRWLSWCGLNMSLPTNLHLEILVVLDLSGSSVHEDWTGWTSIKMVNLKVLNLSRCKQLRRTPEFSAFPILERLILEDCINLDSVDPSVGLLNSLTTLNVRSCRRLRKLPEQLGSLTSLRELRMDHTRIKELPISTGMKKLEILTEKYCGSLKLIPESIGSMGKLKRLSLKSCLSLKELPESIGRLESLVELNLYNTGIEGLPDTIGNLNNLVLLNVDGPKVIEKWILESIPKLPSSLACLAVGGSSTLLFPDLMDLIHLKEIHLSGYFNIKGECLSKLCMLEKLVLTSVSIRSFPEAICSFPRLKEIDISWCGELDCLPTLPPSLCLLRVRYCSSLERLPNVSNLKKLLELHMLDIPMLREIEGLGDLVSLKVLDSRGCPLAKLDGLERLESLRGLRIRSTVVERLPDLSKLKNLQYIDTLDSRLITMIQGLRSLHNLESMKFSGCTSLERLPNLSCLKLLECLYLQGCKKLCKIEGLEELGSLIVLNIHWCKAIEELPDLSKLQRLRELEMEACEKLNRVEGLGELESLELLDISQCKAIEMLPDLSKLRRLREFRMQGCEKLSQLKGLEELKAMELLDISGCKAIEKLPDLSKLQQLSTLKMEDCENITELQGLEKLSKLRWLTISGCKALKLPVLSQLKSNGVSMDAQV